MSLPTQAGAPCRCCLGALVESIDHDQGLWQCTAGRVHAADEDQPPPPPTQPATRELAVAQAFADLARAVEAARTAWVAGALLPSGIGEIDDELGFLWRALEEAADFSSGS